MKIDRAHNLSDNVEALLGPALAHDPTITMEEIAAQVAADNIGLFVVRQGDRIDGAFLARFDGPDLVVPAVGSRSAAPLVRHVVPYLRDMAGTYDCDFVRAHVPTERWEAVLKRYGFEPVERVMRLEVGNGR